MTAGIPTFLVIIPISGNAFKLPPYSARGISQTLEPIVGAGSGGSIMGTGARRDVNGVLVDLTNPLFRKYATSIECKDVEAPALDGAWLGSVVQMACACELSYLTGGSPQRSVVSGSSRVEGSFTFYRPFITFMITEIHHGFEEWQHDYRWKLGAQEV